MKRDVDEPTEVVEMDAIDIHEWDRDRHTPIAPDKNLAALVKQSTAAEAAPQQPDVIKSLMKTGTAHTTSRRVAPAPTAKVDEGWDETTKPTPTAGAPRPAPSPKPIPKLTTTPAASDPPRSKRSTRNQPVQPAAKPATKPGSPPVPPKRATQPMQAVAAPKPTMQPKASPKPAPAPAKLEPPVRASEPALLPPPPPVGAIAPPEDWDDHAPRPERPAPRRADTSDFDPNREPSVVIDLNAVSKTSRNGAQKRPQTSPVIQTSEASTTTSGAFVMPTASAPNNDPWDTVTSQGELQATPTVARHTPTPAALLPHVTPVQQRADASVPQLVAHVETERRVVPRSILATVLPTPRTRRTAVIVCAAAAVLVIILVVALVSGGHSSSAAPIAVAPQHDVVAPTVAPRPARAPHAVVAAASPAPVPTAITTTTPVATTPAPHKAVRRIVRRKPVVVDYDKKPDPATDADRDEALARARTAYTAGNQHLFAGEAAAAIASYEQALAAYPSYVAGYRGLGLAYAQAGDSAAALKAFKTYVRLAPGAKDVALVTKRISRLSAR